MTRTHFRRAATRRGTGLVLALLAAPVLAQEPASRPAPPRSPALLLKVKKAHTGTGQTLAPAVLLIRGERIVALGKELRIPKGAQVIDLSHLEVIPGLVDPMATTFLSPADTQGTGPGPGAPTAAGLVSLPPADARRILDSGTMTLGLVPGVGPGLLAPLTGVRITPEGRPQVLEEMTALQFVFSEDGPADPFAPLKAWEAFDKALKDVDDYRKKKEEAAKAQTDYEKKWKEYLEALRKAAPKPASAPASRPGAKAPAGSKPAASKPAAQAPAQPPTPPAAPAAAGKPPASNQAPTRPKRPTPFKEDPAKEVLLLAVQGKIPVRMKAHSASEVHHALRLAHEHKLSLVLVEPWEVEAADLERLAAAKVPVLFGPLDRAQVDFATLAFDPELLVRLSQAGCPVALGTGGRLAPRFLIEQAALARGLGLSRELALQAITAAAAQASGLGKKAGTLAPGRTADLVFFAGDPLDPTLAPDRIMQGGRFLDQEQQP